MVTKRSHILNQTWYKITEPFQIRTFFTFKQSIFFDWQSFYDRTISFESSEEKQIEMSSLNYFFVNLVMPSALAKEI